MSAPMTCDFCPAAEGLDTCDWPVWKPGVINASALTMDHTIVTRGGKHLRPLTVVRFEYADQFGTPHGTITMYALDYGKQHPAVYVFYRYDTAGVTVLRDVNCGRVCCTKHRCDRGPGGTYCAEHWRAWELAG